MTSTLRKITLVATAILIGGAHGAISEDQKKTPPKPKVEVKGKDLESGDRLNNVEVQKSSSDIQSKSTKGMKNRPGSSGGRGKRH